MERVVVVTDLDTPSPPLDDHAAGASLVGASPAPRRRTVATAVGLVVGLGVAAAYPDLAAARSVVPFPPDAVAQSVRAAALPFGLLAVAAWWGRRHHLAATTASVGTLLVVALGAALYAVALGADSPTAPLRALRVVPSRQLLAAAVAAYLVTLARRSARP